MQSIKQRAAKIVDEAGGAGGIDEVARIEELGWPTHAPLADDSPELREAIRNAARDVLER